MTFITTLIALIIERFFDWSHLRKWRWYERYLNAVNAKFPKLNSYLLFALCVLPLVLAVMLLECITSDWLFGLLRLVFSTLILVYCFGPTNFWAQVYNCMREYNDDPKAAVKRLQEMFGIGTFENSQSFHVALTRALFVECNQRVASVLFWFVALGPAGALLYRLTAICAASSSTQVADCADRTQGYMDWAPARVLTFFFALGGHFTQVFTSWKKYALRGVNMNNTLLGDCGIAALDVDENGKIPEDGSAENEAIALVDRVCVIVVVLLAIMVIVMW